MALSLTHALERPIKNARFSLPFEWRDTAGALTNPTSPDTEFSTDGGATFTDCAEEVSPTGGHGYVTLSGAETNAAVVQVQAKGTGVLTATASVHPADLAVVATGTATAGAASTVTLQVGSSAVDDYYTGMYVRTTSGTGGGGVGGAANQARKIVSYVGSTRVATITPAWETQPGADTTYDLLATDEWVQGMYERIMLALPTAAPDAATGLPVSNAGGLDLDAMAADVAGLDGAAMRGTDSAALASAWTATRAGYVDNLNVGGNVASSAEVTAIQNNTRAVRVVPPVLERPDSGSTAFRIELLLYDETGGMEAPDAAPTISVVNQAGTSRDVNLDSTTMSLVSTGRYRSTYGVASDHAIEELIVAFSVIEGGATRIFANPVQVVDTSAVDFTAADRTKLELLATDYTTARAAKIDNLDVAVSSRGTSTFAGGAVASVTGDVAGKVVGGGVTALTGTGVRAVDASGNALATAAVCTETRLAELDAANLPTTTDAILADTGTDGVVVASLAANSITAAALAADAGVEIGNAVVAINLLTGAVDYHAVAHNTATVGALLSAMRMILAGAMTAPSATSKAFAEPDDTPGVTQTHAADYTTRSALVRT